MKLNRVALVTAIPLLFVNIVAFGGQFGYIADHVNWPTIGQVILALALETIALFLAYMAHQSLMAGDSAYGLRLASYGVGAVIGLLNYSHYAGPDFRPTFLAVATGFMSLASPWLWGIYSRRKNRDALKARGLIEPRAVKLGSLRWLLWRRESWGVFRRAVWSAETDPKRAVAQWEGNTVIVPEVGLPDGYEPPSGSLAPVNEHGWHSEAEWEAEMNRAAEHTTHDNALPVGEPLKIVGPETTNTKEILEAHSRAVDEGYPAGHDPEGLPIEPPPAFPEAIEPPKKSKAEAVREAIRRAPNVPVSEIVRYLSADGYDIKPGYVSQIKQRMKKNAVP